MTNPPEKPASSTPSQGAEPPKPAHKDPWAFLTTPIHPRQTIARHLRGTLIAGLLTAIPIFISLVILVFVYSEVTRFTAIPADWLVKHFWSKEGNENLKTYLVEPTIAVSISLAIVYILGLLGRFVIGRRLIAAGEHFISNLPLIKGIYGTTKQVIGVFRQGAEGGSGFQRVVLVEFPRKGIYTIGFVTKTITDTIANIQYICVFIPMTPNPTSGFFQLFPLGDVRDTDWTVDQGLKILLSGGLLAPTEMPFAPAQPPPSPEPPPSEF